MNEFPKPYLSIHTDKPLAKLGSPQIQALLETFTPGQGVALTVEELCPGGLDMTDGIALAQAFEKAGASFIIANAGTDDFPALKYRRSTQTQKKSNHAWLSSACWLVSHVDIPVYAGGSFDESPDPDLIHQAKSAGLAGIVRF